MCVLVVGKRVGWREAAGKEGCLPTRPGLGRQPTPDANLPPPPHAPPSPPPTDRHRRILHRRRHRGGGAPAGGDAAAPPRRPRRRGGRPPPASRIRVTPCAAATLKKVRDITANCNRVRKTGRVARGGRARVATPEERRVLDIQETLAVSSAQGASVTLAAPAWWHHGMLLEWMVRFAEWGTDTLCPLYAASAAAAASDGVRVEPSPDPDAPRGGDGSFLWRRAAVMEDWTLRGADRSTARATTAATAAAAAAAAASNPNLLKHPPALEWEPAPVAVSAASRPALDALRRDDARIAGLPPLAVDLCVEVVDEAEA